MSKAGKRVLWGAAAMFGGWVAGGAIAFSIQSRIIFPAPTVEQAELDRLAQLYGAEPVHLTSADGTRLYAWHRPAEAPPSGRRGVVFFHGNAETVFSRVQTQDFLVEHGWEVFIVAYRGYPGSEGEPGEKGIRQDAMAAWEWASSEIPPERLVIHGKSLGGGVAATVAEQVNPEALVLESTFLSIPEAARDFFPIYPTQWLVWHRFETEARAASITCPVLIMHGDADTTIRVRHGRALAPLFPDATYIEIPGGDHNTNFPVSHEESRQAYLDLLETAVPAGWEEEAPEE